MTNKQIGIRLRKARLEAGYTQEELADLINMSRASVVNFEKGRQALTLKVLQRVVKLTGFSFATILNDEGEELPKINDLNHSEDLLRVVDEIPEKDLRKLITLYKGLQESFCS